ncbi:NACHT domain-containing protein [Streptomyces sp. NPDC002643]
MLRSAIERTVVVQAGTQGSGVLLSPRLVLTCAHVLRDEEWIRTAHPDGEQPIPSRTLWRDDTLDAALLLTGEDLVAPEKWALPTLRWGTLVTSDPLPGCQVVGFPAVQRYGTEDHLEYDQLAGTVLPMAGRLRQTLVCEFDRAAVSAAPGIASPLAGLSGGPLFAGAVLLGLVTEVPDGRAHRRVNAVPVDRILNAPGFPRHAVGTELSHIPAVLEPVAGFHQQDERFERHYARALQIRYRKTEIFGIDELGTTETSWDLDTAYLSLEAVSAARPSETRTMGGWYYEYDRSPEDPPPAEPKAASVPQRIHDLLTDRPRTLLRGEAGAGKTTLVWWLASHAACGALGHELAELNDLVPFVVPMRSLRSLGTAFPTPDHLPTVAELQIGTIPDGWAQRVLESGRALLLIDGMDEIPPAGREAARRRLTDLLAMYPHNRCLMTVRPLAVPGDWLDGDGFEELRLLPMRDNDVLAFSKAWHAAARLECQGFQDHYRAATEVEHLRLLEKELAKELGRNRTLRNLARTPLLAAVVCALHRRRRGILPETRWSLYNAALSMLLGGRDTLRRVAAPEGIALGVEEHQQLLQRIAAWLARGGYVEFSHAQAEHQIELAMRGMPQVREQGSPAAVLVHLLNRSGLLQERNERVIQFIHRTFQDYLAAKELQESDSLGELLRHVGDEQWHDVILLAVGHCNRGEVRRLVEELIAAGDRASDRGTRSDLHVLAARCAQSAVVLDEELRARAAERVRQLIPPTGIAELENVASLGEYVLPLVPGPGTLSAAEATAVVDLVVSIGGSSSLPRLRAFARHSSQKVRKQIAGAWSLYPADEYAREVLAHMELSDIRVVATTTDMVHSLRHCGPIGELCIEVPVSGAELSKHLPHGRYRAIHVPPNELLDDLSFVRDQSGLEELVVDVCPRLRDLSPLEGQGLDQLVLAIGKLPRSALTSLERLDRLTALHLKGTPIDSDIPLPSGHRSVKRLSLTGQSPLLINDLADWARLEVLTVAGKCDVSALLHAAARAPELNRLQFSTDSLSLPGLREPPWEIITSTLPRITPLTLPKITTLTLTGISLPSSALKIAHGFPALRQLNLVVEEGVQLDLTPLRGHKNLVINVNGLVAHPSILVGIE